MTRNRPTVGTIARQVGVNVETIRYYQRFGLIKEPPKTGGFRIYSDKVVKRLLFIRRLRKLGFTMREIAGLLEVGAKNCNAVRAILQIKKKELLQKIEQMPHCDRETQTDGNCLQGAITKWVWCLPACSRARLVTQQRWQQFAAPRFLAALFFVQ